MRTLLARHPIAVECARSVAEMANARCDIVVFEEDRAFVVASSDPAVMQPRHLAATEQALRDGQRGPIVDLLSGSFPVNGSDGRPVGALTVHRHVEDSIVGAISAQARIMSLVIGSATEETAETEAMATSIMHGLRDAVIVLDDDLTIVWVNRAIGSLIGRSPAELIGRAAVEFLHPDDVEVTLNSIVRMHEGLEIYRLKVRLRRPEGTYEPVEITAVDHSDDERIGGIVLSLRSANVTEELEQSIQRSQRMADAIVGGLHDGIVATDQFGAITVVNAIARDMFDIDADQPAASFRLVDFQVLDHDGGAVDLAADERSDVDLSTDLGSHIVASGAGLRHIMLKRQRVIDADGLTLGSVLIFHDVTETYRSAETLRQQALHDQLTGLPNRRQLEQRLSELSADEASHQVAACFVDLDGFKLVNDNHGHRTGDRLIEIAARRLERVLRRGDLLVRQGGDEFVVLQVDVIDADDMLAVAGRLRHVLARPFTIDGHRFDVTASVGVSTARSEDLDADTLLRQADIALYAAKARGRNRVEVFDQELADAVQVEATQRDFLRDALRDNRLEMHFQALIDARSGRTVGYEALARLHALDGRIAGPSEFIADNTPSDLMFALDCAAFNQSCAAAQRFARNEPDDPPYVACNLSPSTLGQRGLLDVVMETVGRHDVDPSQLCFEVTETAAFNTGTIALETLSALHQAGFRIALDDFGTGYSSLAHLRDFPIDIVKVDRSFVVRLADHGSERAIVAAIVTLAEKLGMGVVAEGVETSEQLDHAEQLGVDTIQGWYYSKARPLREVLDGQPIGMS